MEAWSFRSIGRGEGRGEALRSCVVCHEYAYPQGYLSLSNIIYIFFLSIFRRRYTIRHTRHTHSLTDTLYSGEQNILFWGFFLFSGPSCLAKKKKKLLLWNWWTRTHSCAAERQGSLKGQDGGAVKSTTRRVHCPQALELETFLWRGASAPLLGALQVSPRSKGSRDDKSSRGNGSCEISSRDINVHVRRGRGAHREVGL